MYRADFERLTEPLSQYRVSARTRRFDHAGPALRQRSAQAFSHRISSRHTCYKIRLLYLYQKITFRFLLLSVDAHYIIFIQKVKLLITFFRFSLYFLSILFCFYVNPKQDIVVFSDLSTISGVE